MARSERGTDVTALSANATRPSYANTVRPLAPMPAGVDIFYVGSLVMVNAAGYAMPAASENLNHGCIGVCSEYCDNSEGSAGDKYVKLDAGVFLFTADTVTQAAVGTILGADDDNTVDTIADNLPTAGMCIKFESATSVWVDVGPQYMSTDGA